MNDSILPKVVTQVSFSVKSEFLPILEKFNNRIKRGELNRSRVFVDLMKQYNETTKSPTEQMFDDYIVENNLNRDAIFKLLLTDLRVVVTDDTFKGMK